MNHTRPAGQLDVSTPDCHAPGLSLYFRLGLHWQITIAAGRCILQLTVLGYLLVPVLSYGAIWLVLLFGAAMMFVSAMEAVSRPAWTYKVGLSNRIFPIICAGSVVYLPRSYASLQADQDFCPGYACCSRIGAEVVHQQLHRG